MNPFPEPPSETSAVTSQEAYESDARYRRLPARLRTIQHVVRSATLPKPLKLGTKTLKDGQDTVRQPTSGLCVLRLSVYVCVYMLYSPRFIDMLWCICSPFLRISPSQFNLTDQGLVFT